MRKISYIDMISQIEASHEYEQLLARCLNWPGLKPEVQHVGLAMVILSHAQGVPWPTLAKVCEVTGYTEEQITKALSKKGQPFDLITRGEEPTLYVAASEAFIYGA